ncbi:insulinase family protein, partial [bacterium]|nr:insulinase family protein [bacterium]
MRTFILAMIGMTLCQSLWAAPQLIERVVPSRSPVVVPYSKYRLDNGMTVIINENHRDPIVHVEMMFHVGSAREDIGKSGFAHLFEHMMFQGSKHVPYNAHFQIVTDAGGRMNGSASRDWTTYHETLPRNELETALWLESDRMGYFIDGINQEKFEIQRATVKNEKAQNYDNRPYGLTGAYIDRLLYPVNHPYSWQTIGNVDDLDRVNAEDLKRFFQRWYGPNNATLVIAGDVKTDDALTLVDRYFGPILPGPSVRNTPRKVSTMDAIIYASYEDSLIQQPQLIRAYPAPYRHHYDEAELDAAAFVLGTGANSLLYQALVKTQLASEVDVSNYASELSGEFVISAIPYPGVSLGQLDAAITQCIDSIARDGLAKRQVDQFITRYQVDTMRLLEQLDQTAHQLALNEIIDGHPGFLAKEAARYQLVTTESVRQAVNTYITHRPYVALSVMPKGKLSDRLAPDSPTKSNSATHSVAIRSDIDRSLRPTSNITGYSLNLPIWNTRVNDIPVLGISDTSNELVRITYSIPGGKILASQLGVHNGTAGVLSRLWNQDTAQRSLEDFTSELDRLGASISVEVGLDDTVLSIVALKSNMVPVMTLAAERWFTPRLSDSDFNRVRGELIEVVTSRLSNLDWIADFASVQESYGRSHPMGQSDLGTVPEINAVTLAAVRDLWGQLIRCHRPNISVVGDATEDDIQRWMSEFPVTASVTVP